MLVWEDGNPDAWHMQDFPGKVRQLAWSMPAAAGAPLLAAMSGETVVVWTKDSDPAVGWRSQMLAGHQGILCAIAFQPESLLLATAAEDGLLRFWDKGSDLVQSLGDSSAELSCLAWSQSGGAIAAGDSQGNVLVWEKN